MFGNKSWMILVIALALHVCVPMVGAVPDAAEFKIVAGVEADQTPQIQAYLNAVAQQGGGSAVLPAGQYTIRGALEIPTGVVLSGAWQMSHHGQLDKGTVFRAYAHRGEEAATPLITLRQSSALKGLTIVYPEQTLADIQPYPWTIKGRGMHNTIENVTLVNAYNGICIGPESNELHFIHNVYGCVLRRGVFIDNTTDIGRIENVHFNPHYWPRSGHHGVPADAKPNPDIAVAKYMNQHLEAFIFGRTDWQSVTNTFVFGAKVGYRFVQTDRGMCNGQFLGIGADQCRRCILVDNVAPIGLLVTNGQFVPGDLVRGKNTEKAIALETSDALTGPVSLHNCAFWGPMDRVLYQRGKGFVSLDGALVMARAAEPALVEIVSGDASLKNIRFDKAVNHVFIGAQAGRVVVAENFAPGGLVVIDKSQRAVMVNNE